MRPLKLTMTAFGSYCEKTFIDFERLGKSGLYLITGDTGSGKTTIFDAITYALFGKASGENRDESMLRSTNAAGNAGMEVELTFEYHSRHYTVIRGIKNNAKQDGYATLKCPDGVVYTSKTDVNNAIKDILGIDRKQFSQIAMIAQGDFRKILFADSKERKILFRDIFHTSQYDKIQERLKREVGILSGEKTRLEDAIRLFVGKMLCNEDDPLFCDVEKAKENQLTTADTLELLDKLISVDTVKKSKLTEEKDAIEKKAEDLTGIIAEGLQIEKSVNDLEEKCRLIEEKKPELKILEKAKKDAEGRKEEADKYGSDAAKLEASLSEYEELGVKLKTLSSLEDKIKKNSLSVSENEETINVLKKQLDGYKEELKDIGNPESELAKLQGKIEKLEDSLSLIEKAVKTVVYISDQSEKLKSAQDDYKDKSAQEIRHKAEYDNLSRLFLDGQAGILAETLSDGIPCPVCGSASHPCPAVKPEKAPTEDELKKSRAAWDSSRKAAAEASEKAGKIKAGIDAGKENLVLSIGESLGAGSYDEVIKALPDKRKELTEQKKALLRSKAGIQDRIDRKSKLSGSLIVECESRLSGLIEKNNNLSKELSGDKSLKAGLDERIGTLRHKLQFNSSDAAKQEIQNLKKKKEAIENDILNANRSFNSCTSEISELTGVVEQLENDLKDKKAVDIEAKQNEKQELLNKKASVDKLLSDISHRLVTNEGIKNDIIGRSNELIETERKYSWVKNLCDTANASLNGKEKISFETYVQMAHLDKILEKANTRLMVMSGGQYEMRRRTVAKNLSSQTGLDLDVIDHFSGGVRDIKSLSGGESFEASLSLALGLSDQIQSAAGGIQLDTMFVDEGFGSLDDEAISKALNTLAGLSGENRLVGIISHVEDLKKIDKQIVVKKDKLGNSCAVIFGV